MCRYMDGDDALDGCHGGVGMADRPVVTSEQQRVARALAHGAPLAEAARDGGVHEERVRRWLLDRTFRDAVAKERQRPRPGEGFTEGLVGDSVESQEEVVHDPPATPSAKREMALDLLAHGASVTEAASKVGYSRSHLSSLVHRDIKFARALSNRITEIHEQRVNRFWERFDKAGDVLDRSLEEGDPRTALEIFRLGARGVTDVDYRVQTLSSGELPLSLEADPETDDENGTPPTRKESRDDSPPDSRE